MEPVATSPYIGRLVFGKAHPGGPLWRITGSPWLGPRYRTPETLKALAVPPALSRRIEEWARRGLEARRSKLPPGYSGFADEDSERAYLTEGWELCRELAAVLGDREPLLFEDFGSGALIDPDPKWELGAYDRLGKGTSCYMLARSTDYALTGGWEVALLERRGSDDSLCVDDHYGNVTCGVIAPDQSWCATGGCGVIVYYLRPPWEPYDYDRQTNQWFELERDPDSFLSVTDMEMLDDDHIKLTVQAADETPYQSILDVRARRLL